MENLNQDDLKAISESQRLMNMLMENGMMKKKKFHRRLKYEKELKKLQFNMLQLQSFIVNEGKRLLIIMEGRDAAGKGGTINRCVNALNPKKYKVVALPKPNDIEMGQWYFQRYFKQLPNEEEIVFFDRSWYNRAVVEPVFGFCTQEQHHLFMKQVTKVEKMLQEDGVILIKLFLSISKEEQFERLEERRTDPMKQWKMGGLDKQAQEKWDDYSHYIEKMFQETGTKDSPWIEVKTDKKKTARLESMRHILSHFPEWFEEYKDYSSDKLMKHAY